MRDRSRDPAPAPPRLADAVARLGTESAFAVLTRARRLEARGRSVVHLEIGEPRFPTPGARRRGRRRRPSAPARPATARRPACPSCAPRPRARWAPGAGSTSRPSACSSAPAPSRSCSSPCWRRASPATRCSCPTPASPSTPRRWRWAGATAVPYTGPEALVAGSGARTEARDPQLAEQPDRRRAERRRPRGGRRAHPRVERLGALRRGLLAPAARRRARLDRGLPGMLERTVLLDSLSRPTR